MFKVKFEKMADIFFSKSFSDELKTPHAVAYVWSRLVTKLVGDRPSPRWTGAVALKAERFGGKSENHRPDSGMYMNIVCSCPVDGCPSLGHYTCHERGSHPQGCNDSRKELNPVVSRTLLIGLSLP
jgi:hypothetical protein